MAKIDHLANIENIAKSSNLEQWFDYYNNHLLTEDIVNKPIGHRKLHYEDWLKYYFKTTYDLDRINQVLTEHKYNFIKLTAKNIKLSFWASNNIIDISGNIYVSENECDIHIGHSFRICSIKINSDTKSIDAIRFRLGLDEVLIFIDELSKSSDIDYAIKTTPYDVYPFNIDHKQSIILKKDMEYIYEQEDKSLTSIANSSNLSEWMDYYNDHLVEYNIEDKPIWSQEFHFKHWIEYYFKKTYDLDGVNQLLAEHGYNYITLPKKNIEINIQSIDKIIIVSGYICTSTEEYQYYPKRHFSICRLELNFDTKSIDNIEFKPGLDDILTFIDDFAKSADIEYALVHSPYFIFSHIASDKQSVIHINDWEDIINQEGRIIEERYAVFEAEQAALELESDIIGSTETI